MSFTASPPIVEYGASSELTWSVSGNPTTLTLEAVSAGSHPTSVLGTSSQSVYPVGRQTFTLVASDGVNTAQVSLQVAERGLFLFAGSPSGMAGTMDGQGTSATFNAPQFGAFDSQGNLYVGDTNTEIVRKVDPSGNVTTIAGIANVTGSQNGPAASATFDYPDSVAVAPDGTLYITEGINQQVRKIATDGTVSTVAGSPQQTGWVDANGANARFNGPGGLVLDSQGNLFTTDLGNGVIRKIDPSGNVTTFAGSHGQSGSADGQGTSATFGAPDGLAIDSSDNLYVTDIDNDLIRKIDPNGNVTTIAGIPGVIGSSDGPALSATFNYPSCIAVGADGTVYIADTNNYTIRKLDLNGLVSTLAGVAGTNAIETGPLPGELSNGYGLSVSPAGDVYPLSHNSVFMIVAP